MKDWLNLYINRVGVVQNPSIVLDGDRLILGKRTIELERRGNRRNFTILDMSRSGAVIFEQPNGLATYGDAEVYLVIRRGRREARYLSAPLHTEVKIRDLTRSAICCSRKVGWMYSRRALEYVRRSKGYY